MKKFFTTALLALLGLAAPAGAQVQAGLNDLVLGFRATGGTGQNVNLEVNLGNASQFISPTTSPFTVTRLAVADLTATYGASWATRTDLTWGIIGTAGRITTGANGAPVATIWSTRAREAAATQSTPWTPGSRNGQFNASSPIETLLLGAPGSLNGATATSNSAFSSNVNGTLQGSYSVQDTFQPGTSFGFFNPSINTSVKAASGNYAVADLYELRADAASSTYLGSFGLSSTGSLVFSTSAAAFTGSGTAPAVTTQPASQSVTAGSSITLTAALSGSPTIQWMRSGANVSGATSASLALVNVQPADTGVYQAVATNSGGSITTNPAIVGVTTTQKVIGTGSVVATDIVHPNLNVFDQVLVTGAAEAITASSPKITRTSYIDMNDDIVQIEFAGAGTLSIVLDGAAAPAAPTKYTQPSVSYVKGHAGIVITGANETTNVTIFTVGKATANDSTGTYSILLPISSTNVPANNGAAIFVGQGSTTYDGVADVAFVAITSTNGKFGGLRAANASFWATKGVTGVIAPGVEFTGPVNIGDINAMETATPYLQIGQADGLVQITGGDLTQDNGRAVQVSGLTQVHFKDGSKSSGTIMAAQANRGQIVQNGVDVTLQVALAPGL